VIAGPGARALGRVVRWGRVVHVGAAAALLACAGVLLGAASQSPRTAAAPPSRDDRAEIALILSPYKSRVGANGSPRPQRHAGVDVGAPRGARVLASADGFVTRVLDGPYGCGRGVIVVHAPWSQHTAYCHLEGVAVRAGQAVSRGEVIGQVGTSGDAFGVPHVHWELCTGPCGSHADGDLWGTRDPLAIAEGCFAAATHYRAGRLVLTLPVACRRWALATGR
jgi:murein DD-endopeptidase MepM/ murein hydrolase activator NlpD